MLDTIVIGAGQAGLAMSFHLRRHGREHLVLDRGRVAERWRTQRWDSLDVPVAQLEPRSCPAWRTKATIPTASRTRMTCCASSKAYCARIEAPVLDVDGRHRASPPGARRALRARRPIARSSGRAASWWPAGRTSAGGARPRPPRCRRAWFSCMPSEYRNPRSAARRRRSHRGLRRFGLPDRRRTGRGRTARDGHASGGTAACRADIAGATCSGGDARWRA